MSMRNADLPRSWWAMKNDSICGVFVSSLGPPFQPHASETVCRRPSVARFRLFYYSSELQLGGRSSHDSAVWKQWLQCEFSGLLVTVLSALLSHEIELFFSCCCLHLILFSCSYHQYFSQIPVSVRRYSFFTTDYSTWRGSHKSPRRLRSFPEMIETSPSTLFCSSRAAALAWQQVSRAMPANSGSISLSFCQI